MTDRNKHKILTFFIAAVWLANGLLCKVLNLVPRHEQIVAAILGESYSRTLTVLIGFSEIFMAIWVLTQYKSRINAVVQMAVVAVMNILEFILVPDLLLWGRMNAVFALMFIALVWFNEFFLNKNLKIQTEK